MLAGIVSRLSNVEHASKWKNDYSKLESFFLLVRGKKDQWAETTEGGTKRDDEGLLKLEFKKKFFVQQQIIIFYP